jgi:hypothetical protein
MTERRLSLLAVAGLVLHALVYTDRRMLATFTLVAWAVMVFAAVFDRAIPLRQRLWLVVPPYAISLTACLGVALVWGDVAAAALQFLRYHLWAPWLVVLWLAAPLWTGRAGLWLRSLAGLCVVHAFLCLLSAFAASEPKLSMKLFGSDVAVYVSLFLIILRFAPEYNLSALRRMACGHLALVSSMVGAMLLIVVAYATGGDGLRAGLEAKDWILSESADGQTTWRLVFPFQHHNRTGFVAMTSVFFFMAVLLTAKSPSRRGAAALLMVAALVSVAFSLTRAAMVAAALGLLVAVPVALTANRQLRWVLLLLVAVPAIWLALPEAHRARIRQVTDPAAWIPGRETTTGARLVLWDRTISLVARHPYWGVGYGYARFEQVFNRTYPDLVDKLGGTSHAHNQWLQAAAESGLPAAVAWLAFTLARLALLIVAIRRSWPNAATLSAWLGLEMAIQVYLMTNYTLRYSLGAYTYCVWALGSAMALRALEPSRARPATPCAPDSREVPAPAALS